MSIATAHHYVSTVLERTAQEAPEDRDFLRRQALDRLDRAQLSIWDRVEAGSLDAINVWLKLEERRARLYGLDAPSRQENVVTAAQPHYEVSISAREALWSKIQQMAEDGGSTTRWNPSVGGCPGARDHLGALPR